MTKKFVEVVTPIDINKEFKSFDKTRIDMDVDVKISVKIGNKFGTAVISRGYDFRPNKPEYNISYSDNIGDGTYNVSAIIDEYERARKLVAPLYKKQQIDEKMQKWLDHPIRAFQYYADKETTLNFVMNPGFTQDRFMSEKLYDSDAYTEVEYTYGMRKWKYKVTWDKYRSGGKYELRAIAYETKEKGKDTVEDDSYEESKFYRKSKFSKKNFEIIRYMENDAYEMKNRLDEKAKEEAEEAARCAKINEQWKVEGGVIEDIESSGFSVVMDKKKSKNNWDTTAKKVDIEIIEGKKSFKVGNIEAEFTKAQVEEIIAIVKKAKVTTF